MRVHRNRSLIGFTAGMVALALLGALHFLEGSSAGEDRLIVLTPHGDNIRQEMGAAFRDWHAARFGTSPEVEWVDQGGTSEGLRYVLARFAKTPASIGIDVFFGGGTPPFRAMAKEGLLVPDAVPLPPDLPLSLAGIKLQSPEEGWYGVALSSFGILSNLSLLRSRSLPEPRSWADLARPEALGWVASVDPRGSGSAHVIYEIVLQKFGWEKGWSLLARMAANSRTFTRGASGVLPLLSAGEAAYTVAIDQYAWSLIGTAGADRIGFVLPAGETVITPDPAAILKGAPHPETARRFLEFLLSPAGQRLWVQKPGTPGGPAHLALSRLAVLPEVYDRLDSSLAAVGGNPFAAAADADRAQDADVAAGGGQPSAGGRTAPGGRAATGFAYSDSLTESRWALVSDALGLWMVDSHDAARRAWEPLAARGIDGKEAGTEAWEAEVAANPYFRPPGTWTEMEALAVRWKDTEFRNATMARWASELAQGGKGAKGESAGKDGP